MRSLVLALVAALVLPAQTTKEISLPISPDWLDTGIKLDPGDSFSVEVSGQIILRGLKGEDQPTTPAGLARGFRDLIRVLPLNSSGRGAVIGRLGNRETSQPFLIGTRRDGESPLAGNLFLALNLGGGDSGTGAFTARITIRKAPPRAASPAIVELSQAQLDSLPTRVEDAAGTPGDRVNFIIAGSEASVTTALKSAGWVQVDRNVKSSVINAVLISMSKQAYLTLPMSELMMFGRGQDYGFAHAVPFVVVAQRHHFRIWRAPFQLNGTDVWVGAGTHDIGFEKDQRNGSITHKIDPETDKERDYIGQTLEESGLVIRKTYMTHKTPVKEAKTAHGASFFSDGRTLVVYLEQKRNENAVRFSNLFCSVLRKNPDGGEWGPCEEYVETPPDREVDLKAISREYRVVVVPGIFSSCASEAPAFDRGRAHLKEAYGVDASLLNIPNNSSEDNARQIASYLREQWGQDQRKFILVGYSKGTPDIQMALATEPDIRKMVAAFISVAGASGGSPVADALPARLSSLFGKVNGRGGCQGDLSDGFKSLAVEKRRQFLAQFPKPFVPTYSLPAIADADRVSKAILQSWTIMNSISPRNDAQLTETDATVPFSTTLGAARSDHFALALPLENMQGGMLKTMLDKNRYPRAALLEALLRYVLEDLKAPTPSAPPAPTTKRNSSIFQP
jgi:hypothetical protein